MSHTPARLTRGAAVAAMLVGAVAPRAARAAGGPAPDDGAYGRWDADLGVSLEVGIAECFPGEELAGRLVTTYLHTVGTYVQYGDSLGLTSQPSARSVAAGLELRPAFIARFTSDLEQGPALLDLFVDSLALSLGLQAVAGPSQGCNGGPRDCWGLGMEVGLGLELPLLARAEGPFLGLRGAARFLAERPALSAADLPDAGGVAMLSLGYRLLASAHLVDAADMP